MEEEKDLFVVISKNATFKDLYLAIEELEEKEDFEEFQFEEELWDNFDAEVVNKVHDLLQEQKDIKVLDFFEEHGYTQEEISVFLPIKFTN